MRTATNRNGGMTGKTLPFLVGERWSYGGGESFPSINPANGTEAARVSAGRPEDVKQAAEAANKMLNDAAWRDLPSYRRADLLRRFGDLIARDAEELARTQTTDCGKTIAESRAQASAAADIFRYFASVCEVQEGGVVPERGAYMSFTRPEPIGVVAAITPWNSPLTLEAQKIAPALAAGCTMVVKPSEVTPQISLRYAALALEAGFPPGVLNVVTGFGDAVGAPLVAHPLVNMVTFTGGTDTGRVIARQAGELLKPALMELGGKSPNIIFDDANLDSAIPGAAYAIFSNCGQSCLAGSRIFVQKPIFEKVVGKLSEITSKLKLGDPYDATTAISPMASFEHRDRVADHVRRAVDDGALLIAGGEVPQDIELSEGAYYRPTILAVRSNADRIAQEEIFGPVAVVIPFNDERDLIEQANDTVYGLACGIWAEDYRRALRVARAVRAGTVWINTYKTISPAMPFGGFGDSGMGRECGLEGIRPYQGTKSYYLNLNPAPVNWPPSQ